MVPEEILDEIVACAESSNDIAAFGEKVADILYEYGLIDEGVYEVLTGKQ